LANVVTCYGIWQVLLIIVVWQAAICRFTATALCYGIWQVLLIIVVWQATILLFTAADLLVTCYFIILNGLSFKLILYRHLMLEIDIIDLSIRMTYIIVCQL
jgi:hypothetical protein